jgi:hypothetical protein
VTSSSLVRETPRGTIRSEWRVDGGRFSCQISVPVGLTAEVRIPGGETVLLGDLWISDGVLETWKAHGGKTVTVEHTDLVCTPIQHEPIPASTLDVVIPDFVEGVEDVIVMRRAKPVDLGEATSVFVSFDTDNPGIVGRAVRVFVRLRSSDGSTVEGIARPLPIAWNRVTIDVSAWPFRGSVVEVAAGIRWTDELDDAFGPPLPSHPRHSALPIVPVGSDGAMRQSDTEDVTNPVITVMNAGPSFCRVGDQHYLVTSKNEYLPGLPGLPGYRPRLLEIQSHRDRPRARRLVVPVPRRHERLTWRPPAGFGMDGREHKN